MLLKFQNTNHYQEIRRNKLSFIFLLSYVFILPVSEGIAGPGGISIVNYLGVLYAFCVFIELFINKNRIKLSTELLLFFLYNMYVVFSIIWSIEEDIPVSESPITYFFSVCITFILLYDRLSETEMKVLLHAIMLGILSVILIILSNKRYLRDERLVVGINRYFDPNYFAANLVLMESLFLELLFLKQKLTYILPFAICTIVTFMTGSRGVSIAVVVMTIYYLFLSVKLKKKSNISICIILVLILGLWWWKWGQKIIDSAILERYEVSNVIEGKGTGRFDIWRQTLEYFFKSSSPLRLLFGYGYDSFSEVAYLAYHGDHIAHNIFIQVLVEGGFVGLFFLAAMLLRLFWTMVKQKRYFLSGALVGYMVVGLTLDINRTRVYGLMIALILLYAGSSFSSEKVPSTTNALGTRQAFPNVR
jgi:O-antigen ligase